MKVSHIVLVIALLSAVGSWVVALGSWSTALEPAKFGALLLALASVLGAAFGVNKADIIKPNGTSNVINFPPPPTAPTGNLKAVN